MNIIDYHIALTVLFVAAFFAMVVWVFLPSRRKKYRDIANQPLEDDQRKQSEKEEYRNE